MEIDDNTEIKKLCHIRSRNQSTLALNMGLLKTAGFKPDEYVHVIYEPGIIYITH